MTAIVKGGRTRETHKLSINVIRIALVATSGRNNTESRVNSLTVRSSYGMLATGNGRVRSC